MNQFEKFLLNNPTVQTVIGPLKESACILIKCPEKDYYFKVRNKKPILETTGEDPDFIFTSTEENLNKIFEKEHLSIGEYGVALIEGIVRQEIKVKLNIGILSFISKGYLGILSLGGKEFLAYLKNKGITLKDIGKILKKFKS